ncbi:MAG: hypothetical protein U9O64_06920, partial [Campylobacterota bacterium]|nr:hypothetical protein [Campylobacterota bacterium]
MKQIQVFGDSHARYFEINDKLTFHAPWIKNIEVDVYKIPASTIIGLGKKRSKLDVKTLINEKIDKNKINIFAF